MRAPRTLATTVALAAAVGAAPAVAHAATDTTPPVITNVKVTPDAVDVTTAAKTITVTFGASDDQSLRSARVVITQPAAAADFDGVTAFPRDPAPTTGTVTETFTLPPGMPSGDIPIRLSVRDTAGNVAEASTTVHVTAGPRDWAAPAVTCSDSRQLLDTTFGPARVHTAVTITDPAGVVPFAPLGPVSSWTTTSSTPTSMSASIDAEVPQGSRIGSTDLTLLAGDWLGNQKVVRCPIGDVSARIAGPDRYATAAEASRLERGPVGTVYIASGENYPDAISGAAAGDGDGGVLLTRRDSLPATTATALTRLAPRHIVVLGSTASVSAAVASSLTRFAPVTRIGGADRYAVSATAARTNPRGRVVYLAAGDKWADALAAAANRPAGSAVLLAHPAALGSVTAQVLAALAPTRVVLVGAGWPAGYAASVQKAAQAPVSAVAGADRYAVAAQLYPRPAQPTAFVVSGLAWADALAIASHAEGRSVYLSAPTVLSPATREAASTDGRTTGVVAVGGATTILDSVQRQAVESGAVN